jgi:hypothetical protein
MSTRSAETGQLPHSGLGGGGRRLAAAMPADRLMLRVTETASKGASGAGLPTGRWTQLDWTHLLLYLWVEFDKVEVLWTTLMPWRRCHPLTPSRV